MHSQRPRPARETCISQSRKTVRFLRLLPGIIICPLRTKKKNSLNPGKKGNSKAAAYFKARAILIQEVPEIPLPRAFVKQHTAMAIPHAFSPAVYDPAQLRSAKRESYALTQPFMSRESHAHNIARGGRDTQTARRTSSRGEFTGAISARATQCYLARLACAGLMLVVVGRSIPPRATAIAR